MVQTLYDIVKAHGGKLKEETNVGGGTTFTIILTDIQNHGNHLIR